jgi:GGDEF domain-containing protein
MSTTPEPLAIIVDPEPESRELIASIVRDAGMEPRAFAEGHAGLECFFGQPPQCLIVRHGTLVRPGRSLLDEIKSDNVYGHLPVILVLRQDELDAGIEWMHVPADDYVIEPFTATELLSRIRMCWSRAQRDINANPLTGLPGNLTITFEAERRLKCGEPFAFGYLDLDGFKAYNDKYGFGRGDEGIRMTARVLVNSIRALNSHGTYIGHVGGDDFVFITPPDLMAKACERIITAFDLVVPDFYDEVDRKRGGIDATDRHGHPQHYPLMTCSIGAVDTVSTQITHIAELFSRVTEVKAFAKRLPGSNYIIDRRK